MAENVTRDLSTHKIFSDGNELPGTFTVMSVIVSRSINKIPTARIILKDGDPAAQQYAASNSQQLEPGKLIRIEGGFHNKNKVLFEGYVIRQHLRLKNGKDSYLVVECKDKAYRMTLAPKSRYFIDSTDSAAVETLLSDHDLKKDVASTPVTHPQLVQYNCTDWDFMVSRMELNGMMVLALDGTVKCLNPKVESTATVKATFGTDIISLDAALDATHQYSTVTCKAWDFSSQEIASSDNQSPGITEAGDLSTSALSGKVNESSISYVHSGKISSEELKHWATARQTKFMLSKSRGVLTCKGKFEAEPAGTIELSGFGNHFNGRHFISAVTHELKENLWESHIQFGWWPELFSEQYPINAAPAAGMLPAINGLQVGIVTQLQDDPASEFRVLVKIPVMDNAAEGIWARMAFMDAGKERGSFFLPEIGDEVILGFINSDPRDAVILGMFNSSGKPAALTPSDGNHEKGIFTRSKMKIHFNDDKKSLLIHTPAGKEILLDEDQGKILIRDENNNRIEMSAEGILIESCKDLKMKAAADFKGEGVNVEMKGSGNFKGEGSGGAKISSSGMTEVKGSIVNIN